MASLLTTLNRINRQSITAAGPRYSPGVSPDAPNLVIESLSAAIESLGQSELYKESLANLEKHLVKAWNDASPAIQILFMRRRGTPVRLARLLFTLRSESPGSSQETLRMVSHVATRVSRVLTARQNKLWQQQSEQGRESKEAESTRYEIYRLNQFQDAVRPILAFIHSADFRLVTNNRMFIRGEWGTGKTHFLCDITRLRMARKLPTLFFLAHRLPSGTDLLTAIRIGANIATSNRVFLQKLNRLGLTSKGRTLLIVDGINEADRAAWKKGLYQLARDVRNYPNIGFVISCRTPYDQQIFTTASHREFTEVVHQGFQEIEFDAQREFFRFYKIPNPHVPLLAAEFSRPLFLKILCTTFAGLTAASKTRRIHDIAAGQKGMTKLFEDFINYVGETIERDFRLPGKTCWRILKGKTIHQATPLIGIAVSMANHLTDSLPLGECISIISQITNRSKSEAGKIFRRMLSDGLLVEDSIFQDNAWKNIVRLSYQRFSDHLICRHLLECHLNSSSEQAIRRSFYRSRPLGAIFEVDRFSPTYRFPGLASALMLEFPERVKRTLPAGECGLTDPNSND